MSTKQLALAVTALLGSLSMAACDLDVPDLNNPLLDELEANPTVASITAACTGLLIGNRRNQAAENGYVDQLGILGREALNTDNADPRYTSEMLAGTLSRSSPFGGNFWAQPYANIRLANVILGGLGKVAEFSDAERSAIRGFVHTIQALDLLEVIVTHDTNGAVIDTDHPIGADLGPIVDKDVAYAEIVRLLEAAVPELDAGGAAFPFALSNGFKGSSAATSFDTPATFRTFNRAIRARVAAYLEDYATVLSALAMSFIDDSMPPADIDFDRGIYYTYSTKTGDATNGLINVNIFVNPPVQIEAQKKGALVDARLTRKTGLNDDMKLVFNKLYAAPDSPVALIRNEELILLKAEALFFTGMVGPALNELNLVREGSGELLPLVGVPNRTTFIDELLYERRYSLLFEGGHRWIDLRRFGIPLPLDNEKDERNVRYPIPLAECDARPADDPHCAGGST
jgi:hypothetical protein